MFGKKKQKQETLVRMRNLAQLDEGFFAHMKDGKDMFDATAREIRNTYQQLGAGITQIQENIKEASQMAADNGEKEQELTDSWRHIRSRKYSHRKKESRCCRILHRSNRRWHSWWRKTNISPRHPNS